MHEIEIDEITPSDENDMEHVVAFHWGGRRLKARVILPNAADRARWVAGSRHRVSIRLVRGGPVARMAPGMRPGLDDEDEAMWRAIGPVLAMDGDIATVDVGFPLAVDLARSRAQPQLVPELVPGDSLAVRGELRVGDAADADDAED